MWQTLAKVLTNFGLNIDDENKTKEDDELEAIRAKFNRRDQVRFLFSSQGYPGVIAESDGTNFAPQDHEQPRITHTNLQAIEHWNVKNLPVQVDYGSPSAAELLEQTAKDLISKPGVAEHFPTMRKHPLDELIEKQSQTGNLIVPTDFLRKKTPTQNNLKVSRSA